MKNIRHGDLALIGVAELPEGLTASDSNILMRGSGGNDHTFDKGIFYPGGGPYLGYLVAKDTSLLHPDHGGKTSKAGLRKASIPDGIYELRRQIEDTHDGMKEVVD